MRLLFILLFSIASLGAQEIPYDKEVRSFDEIPVEQDGRITLLLKDMNRISGHFVKDDPDTVTVRDDTGELRLIPRDAIAYCRLEFDKSRRAIRYGMWGGVIGLFAGIPYGSYQINRRQDDESVSDSFIYIGSSLGAAVVGGLVGTGIGLATIPGDVVYKIEK